MKKSVLLVVLGIFAISSNSFADIKEVRKTLSSHETVAEYQGSQYRTCRGKTGNCPNDCGNSGTFVTFKITKYLKYSKPGKYGDAKKETFTFQTLDNKKNVKVDAKTMASIKGLTKGDKVLLSWNHDYVTKNKSSSPERKISKLKKYVEEKEDSATGELKKVTVKGRGNLWKVGDTFLLKLDDEGQKLEGKKVKVSGKLIKKTCFHCEKHMTEIAHLHKVFEVTKITEVKAKKESVEGKVQLHSAGIAIGGETDPQGYYIQHKTYKRLYLRMNGSLTHDSVKLLKGKKVTVTGTFSTITAGGVETKKRTFQVLDIKTIKQIEKK